MAPQNVSHTMRVEKRTGGNTIASDKQLDRAARLDAQRGASSKITKVRQERGATSILSAVGNKLFRRKKLKRAANVSPQMGRSIVARNRGYFAGASGVRGQGRDTGTTNPLTTSSRADLLKIGALGRPFSVGVYLPKVGG